MSATPRGRKRIRSVRDILSPRGRVDALSVLTPKTQGSICGKASVKQKSPDIRKFIACVIVMHLFTSMLLFSVKTYATTIERRYGLSSSMVGTIVASSDVGHLTSLIPSALLASRFARPRIIAIGGILMAIGGFLCSAPHFFCGLYNPVPFEQGIGADYEPQLCADVDLVKLTPTNASTILPALEDLRKTSSAVLTYFNTISCTKEGLEAFFVLATFLLGLGAGPVVTLHFSYVDDYAPHAKSPVYLALIQMFSVCGIIFSYSAAGVVSRLYVDIGRLSSEEVFLKAGDVMWVGAWWIAFLFASTGAAISSLPLLCFGDTSEKADDEEGLLPDETTPLRPPTSAGGGSYVSRHHGHHHSEKRHNEQQSSHHHYRHHQHGHHHASIIASPVRPTRFKEEAFNEESFIHPLIHILTNGALVVSLVSTVGWHFQPVMNGTFVLKYLQQEFDFSVASSSITVGCIIWIPACLGILIGGYLHSHFHLNNKQTSIFLVSLMIIGSVCYPAGCPTRHVVGLSVVTPETARCADLCHCERDVLELGSVCGSDGLTYATPCKAGCEVTTKIDGNAAYDKCRCVGLIDQGKNWNSTTFGNAADGNCKSRCKRIQLIVFIANFVLRVLVLSMTYVPYGLFVMRSVKVTDKAVAIAAKEIVGKLLGDIPGNILTGKVFDSTCLFWSKEQAGGCQLYDLESLRIRFWLVNIIPSLIAVCAFLYSIKLLDRQAPPVPPVIRVQPPEGCAIIEEELPGSHTSCHTPLNPSIL